MRGATLALQELDRAVRLPAVPGGAGWRQRDRPAAERSAAQGPRRGGRALVNGGHEIAPCMEGYSGLQALGGYPYSGCLRRASIQRNNFSYFQQDKRRIGRPAGTSESAQGRTAPEGSRM